MSVMLQEAAVSFLAGPKQKARILPVFLVIDSSGSMFGAKIGSVNAAIRNVLPSLEQLDSKNPGVEIVVQIIAFDDDARRIYPAPVPVSQITFVPIETGCSSNMGAGLTMVREEFEALTHSGKKYKQAVLVVLSDGAVSDWQVPLQELLAIPLGNASQRICFAVGAGADKNMLRNVISPEQDDVFEVDNASDLADMIIMATESAAEEASKGKSSSLDDNHGGFALPEINKSLLPADAVMKKEDVAKKLKIDSKLIF